MLLTGTQSLRQPCSRQERPIPCSAAACRDCVRRARLQTASHHAKRAFTLQQGPLHLIQAQQQSSSPSSSKPGADFENADSSSSHETHVEEGVTGSLDKIGVQGALGALRWYKSIVSPLLPRSCMFLPTCSEYSMQAYTQFGFAKGTVLTAWRLMRCNPLNFAVRYQGTLDPPKWPPVGFAWTDRILNKNGR